MLKKANYCAIVIGFLCTSAYAQSWPLPNYTTPNTNVMCTAEACDDANAGLPSPGWQDPVVRFVGRFMSSEFVGDYAQPFRTARDGGIQFTPDNSRVIMKLGNAVASWDTASFLRRIDAHEGLVSVGTVPTNPTVSPGYRFYGPLEILLNFERFFYAENTPSGWTTPLADGQDRLINYDVDDRGYVYLAYSMFGWGVANDVAGSTLMPSWQDKNSLVWGPVSRAFWVKDGANYYALLQNVNSTQAHVFKVTLYNNVTEVAPFQRQIGGLARGTGVSAMFVTPASNAIYVYNNHDLVSGGSPAQTIAYTGLTITHVIFDGTNFWTASFTPALNCVISKLSPDGNGGFTRTNFPTSYGQPISLKYNSGYLAAVTLDNNGRNIHLYKTASGSPVEIPVDSISNYFRIQAGYAAPPSHMRIWSADPIVSGGKLYLIVNADGIGDVYQIRTEDSVNVSIVGPTGSANPNAPARTPGDIFYGDAVAMNALLSSGVTGGAMTWNFGAVNDPANTLPGTFGTAVTHQYTGLSLADVTSPLNVTVTNSATGTVGTVPLILKKGVARVKYGNPSGTKSLISVGSTSTPIVVDDQFYDASDGITSGHYAEWRIGPDAATITAPAFVPQYSDPLTAVPVGTCGQHTLSMTAHYGYAAFSANNVDFPSTISAPFNYSVSAFAPGADVSYNATTGNEEFFSTSRAAAVLAGRTFSYTWDVVDSNGTVVTTIAPQSGTTTSVDTIPRYPVAKALFTQAGYKGRLTLSVSGVDPCSQTGGAMPSQQATSGPLVTPDAVFNASCSSGVCTYTINSPSNVMQSDAWTFAWTATSGSPSSGTGSSLTTSYFTAGNFPVSVIVTNKTGLTKTLNYTANITTPASLCALTASNTGITFAGTNASTGCVDGSSGCLVGEPIQFSLAFFPSPPSESCLTSLGYSWKVDGGAAQNGSTVTTTFTSSGTHTVTVTLTFGTTSLPLTKSLTVGTGNQIQPTGCSPISNQNFYVDYSGQNASCHAGGTCTTTETITADAHTWNYTINSGCSLSYRWSFDGGAPVVGGVEMTHVFSTPGNHTIACTVTAGTSSAVSTASVTVSNGQTAACPVLHPNQNVFLNYSGATSGCGNANLDAPCKVSEPIAFSVGYWNYTSDCGPHHYTWKVDGSQVGSDADNTTVSLTSGQHTVSVTIDNGNTPATTMSQTISISTPVTPNYSFTFDVVSLAVPQFSYAFTVVVTPDTPSKPTQWQWNFGDGSPAYTAGAIQTHTFPDDKAYTVTVSATDGTGGIVSKTIEPPAPPSKRRGVRH